jgi:hypothetical protein
VPDSAAAKPVTINLRIPAGTPLRVALDKKVRISTPGQPVQGEIIETVYAFDQPVVPAGSAITGYVKKIEPGKKWRRIQAYANGNFTPPTTIISSSTRLYFPAGNAAS